MPASVRSARRNTRFCEDGGGGGEGGGEKEDFLGLTRMTMIRPAIMMTRRRRILRFVVRRW